jgi:hypothetical protein
MAGLGCGLRLQLLQGRAVRRRFAIETGNESLAMNVVWQASRSTVAVLIHLTSYG